MTKQQRQKRASNIRFHAKKRAMGWRYFSAVLPPEVTEQLLATKLELMRGYRVRFLTNESPADDLEGGDCEKDLS